MHGLCVGHWGVLFGVSLLQMTSRFCGGVDGSKIWDGPEMVELLCFRCCVVGWSCERH